MTNNAPLQTNVQKVKPQYLTCLMMLYVTFTLMGCPLLFKIIHVGFINGPGGLVPLPLVLLLEDIIAEVYGYRVSRILLWYLLLSMLIFIFGSVLIVNMPSPADWHGEAAYQAIFNPLAKGVPIMVLGIFCGRFSNLYLITKLKVIMKGRYFGIRSIVSCLFGDLIALLIIYTFAFWSFPFSVKAHLFLSDLSVRVIYSLFGGFLGVYVVRFLKKKEGIDVYDTETKFNPFSFKLGENRKAAK